MLTFWENMGVAVFQALIAELHVNPAKLAAINKILIPIRDSLNLLLPAATYPPAA
jgi:hypothetical protein